MMIIIVIKNKPKYYILYKCMTYYTCIYKHRRYKRNIITIIIGSTADQSRFIGRGTSEEENL